jgi:hypothetical protein
MWTFTELLRHIYGGIAEDDVNEDGREVHTGWISPPSGFPDHFSHCDPVYLKRLFGRLDLTLEVWCKVESGEDPGWFEYKIVW